MVCSSLRDASKLLLPDTIWWALLHVLLYHVQQHMHWHVKGREEETKWKGWKGTVGTACLPVCGAELAAHAAIRQSCLAAAAAVCKLPKRLLLYLLPHFLRLHMRDTCYSQQPGTLGLDDHGSDCLLPVKLSLRPMPQFPSELLVIGRSCL